MVLSDLNTEFPGKIAVQRLQDRAREDLLQKVTAENVMVEYFSKFVNSCVCSTPPHVTLAHPVIFYSHTPLLHAIDGIVWKTRNTETDAMVRKKLVESTGDDPHISSALELFLQNVIEENGKRIVGRCSDCFHGYTISDQLKDGKCQNCTMKRVLW